MLGKSDLWNGRRLTVFSIWMNGHGGHRGRGEVATPLWPLCVAVANRLDNVSRRQIVKEVSLISAMPRRDRMTSPSI
jgi:hypothetical protein